MHSCRGFRDRGPELLARLRPNWPFWHLTALFPRSPSPCPHARRCHGSRTTGTSMSGLRPIASISSRGRAESHRAQRAVRVHSCWGRKTARETADRLVGRAASLAQASSSGMKPSPVSAARSASLMSESGARLRDECDDLRLLRRSRPGACLSHFAFVGPSGQAASPGFACHEHVNAGSRPRA
jgi:hypothetical protein